MDESVFNRIFSAAAGVWAIFAMVTIAVFKTWPLVMARINERHRDKAAEESADHARLLTEIARLDSRCDHLQQEVDDCRRREGEWMARAIAAEAYQLGEGEALQKAQRIVSIEREADAKRRDGPAGGGK